MNRHARQRMLRNVLPNVHSLCDVGCGSGESALEFARRGLEVHAVDLSPVFCEMVRGTSASGGTEDRGSLPGHARLQAAWSGQSGRCRVRISQQPRGPPRPSGVLQAAFHALAAGGWIYFDVNTPLSLRTQYPQTFSVEEAKFKLAQHGTLEPDRRRARLDFDWLVPSGRLWRHVRETLWHVCWTDAEIRRALRLAGFDLVRRADGLDVRPRTPETSAGGSVLSCPQTAGRPKPP